MRVIVAGSRDFTNTRQGFDVLDKLIKESVEIVSGGARGADAIGEAYAKSKSCKLTVFPADWATYGKSAGYKRNVQMAEYAKQDAGMLIAFWDGQSKGTKHMIDIATKYGLAIKIVRLKTRNQ
jgi:hypothetical protein